MAGGKKINCKAKENGCMEIKDYTWEILKMICNIIYLSGIYNLLFLKSILGNMDKEF